MARKHSNLEKIRAELAWVNETPDPNKCGCRHLRCCKETGHKPAACTGVVATEFGSFRWEYYCAPCREYDWCGAKARGNDVRIAGRSSRPLSVFLTVRQSDKLLLVNDPWSMPLFASEIFTVLEKRNREGLSQLIEIK